MKASLLFILAAAIGGAVSCGGTNSGPKDAGKNGSDVAVPDGYPAGSGGAFGSGGIGGVAGGGGSVGAGGSSVGATGGNQGTGGLVASGGNTAIGGASATGGMNASGGATARGGAASSGGVVTTGGNAAGGNTATGGRTATGGATATGGQTATGGKTASGGSTAAGGGGGTSTGGITSTGGRTGAGGATPSGGSTGSGGSTSLSWEFASDAEGWICDFADCPPNIGTGYDLECGWSALPAEVGPGGGMRMNSNNHSDDMFMYLMRQITGLAPQTTYQLDVVAVIDTNAPADCGGIGGSPGGSVAVKIGAVTGQPTASTDSLGWLWLNLDKGNQSRGGVDMKVVGDLGNSRTCPDRTYEPKTYTLSGFQVTSASDGTLWLILGTDSGFEGITTIYYDRIAVTLRRGN